LKVPQPGRVAAQRAPAQESGSNESGLI